MRGKNSKKIMAMLLTGLLLAAGSGHVASAAEAVAEAAEGSDLLLLDEVPQDAEQIDETVDAAVAEQAPEPVRAVDDPSADTMDMADVVEEIPVHEDAAEEQAQGELSLPEEELQETASDEAADAEDGRQTEFSTEAIDGYIATDMEFGADAAEAGGFGGDRRLLRASGVPSSYVPDIAGLPPLRNQGAYGNCWAYAVTALAEFGRGADYSENALTYSLFANPADPLGGAKGDAISILTGESYMNIGGNSFWGLEMLSQWWGPLAEGSVAANAAPGSVPASTLRSDALHLESFYMINKNENPNIVKQMIQQHGVVSAAYFDPSKAEVAFDTYFRKDETNNIYAFYYAANQGTQNHAIAIVGWDDAYPAENFPTNPGVNGAWLVRNSWGGVGYGYDGYFWMSYAEPSLSATFYAAEFGSAGNYDNNYYYDGCVSNQYLHNETTTLKAANVFTVHAGASAEVLKAVSVGIASANTTATVEIYTDVKNAADPTGGTKVAAATTTKSFLTTGQYTIPLASAVKMNKGTKFSVVVTLTNTSSKGASAKIMRENANTFGGGQVQAVYGIQTGESFWYNGSGWLDLATAKNGGGNLRIKAFTQNAAADPTPTPTPAPTPTPTLTPTPAPLPQPDVTYQTHVQDYGWQGWVKNGAVSGTTGKSKRLEGIRIRIGNDADLGVEYRTHIQNIGWENGWKQNGTLSGTTGRSLRLEAIQIRLTGSDASKFDVYYCAHAQNIGWLGWAKNGESAGTAGYAYRLEGIMIRIVPKGSGAPQRVGTRWASFSEKDKEPQIGINNTGALLGYTAHVQNIGWQEYVYDREMAGTSGRSLRLEGVRVRLMNQKFSGSIEYRTHVQNIGWQSWVKDGALAGTTGRSLRLEALQVRLTGEMAKQYDVYYQTHVQNIGWTGWAKNGMQCGSAGYAYRMEGLRICLVPKGGKAPGSTSGTFYQKS